ncbi:MAG: type VI secretion system baseplate subunit TssK [Fibrobacterales bacterium]
MIKKISWLEGMALLPHHFQQAEKYYESLISSKIIALNPNSFGFTSLTVDSYALSNGVFSIQECKGIFPSGLFFESNDVENLVESRSVGEMFPAEKESLDVFLAAPLQEETKANVTDDKQSSSALFIKDQKAVPDVNTGSNSKAVTYSKLNLKIVFEGEQITGYEVLKVAELKRNLQAQIAVSDTFMPITLAPIASPYVQQSLKKVIDKATEKQTWLIGQNLVMGGENLSSCLLLLTLNQFLPVLNSYYINSNTSTEQLYIKLLEFAGALCTTNPVVKSNELPIYNHASQQHCFEKLFDGLKALLEASVDLRYELTKMKQSTAGEYQGDLTNANPSIYSEVFLAIDSPLDTQTLVTQVKQIGRAAPIAKLKSLVVSALPGIDIDYVLDPPLTISPKPEKTYFKLSNTHPLWNEVVATRMFGLHLPPAITVTAVEIIGLKS